MIPAIRLAEESEPEGKIMVALGVAKKRQGVLVGFPPNTCVKPTAGINKHNNSTIRFIMQA